MITAAHSPHSPSLTTQVRNAVRLRHYSRRTEHAYTHWIHRFIKFCGMRHPRELGPAEVTRFLSSLAVEGEVSASTQNQALSALLFLYTHVLAIEIAAIPPVARAHS